MIQQGVDLQSDTETALPPLHSGSGCVVGYIQRRVTASAGGAETQETITALPNLTALHLSVLFIQWCVNPN